MRKPVTFGMEPVKVSDHFPRSFPSPSSEAGFALLPRVNCAVPFEPYFDEWLHHREVFRNPWSVSFHLQERKLEYCRAAAKLFPRAMHRFNNSRLWRRCNISGCRLQNMWYTQSSVHFAAETLLNHYGAAFELFSSALRLYWRGGLLKVSFDLPEGWSRKPRQYVNFVFGRANLDPKVWQFRDVVKICNQWRAVFYTTSDYKPHDVRTLVDSFDLFYDVEGGTLEGCDVRLSAAAVYDEDYYHESVPPEFNPIRYRWFSRFGAPFVDARKKAYITRTLDL